MWKSTKQFRLKNYDYASAGLYFVTICTKNKENFFGDFDTDTTVKHSPLGIFAQEAWEKLKSIYPTITLDELAVLPNHLHGIIAFHSQEKLNAPRRVPTGITPLVNNSLGSIINHFKGAVTKKAKILAIEEFSWQPRYFDRVIRTQQELENIRNYIFSNAVYHIDEEANNHNIATNYLP